MACVQGSVELQLHRTQGKHSPRRKHLLTAALLSSPGHLTEQLFRQWEEGKM